MAYNGVQTKEKPDTPHPTPHAQQTNGKLQNVLLPGCCKILS